MRDPVGAIRQRDIAVQYESIVRRGYILLAAHVVFGLAAGLALIFHSGFTYYPRRGAGGVGVVIWHLFASWPYVVSGAVCFSRAVVSNARLLIQISVLSVTTLAAIAVYYGATSIHLSGLALGVVPLAQFVLFSFAVIPLAGRPGLRRDS